MEIYFRGKLYDGNFFFEVEEGHNLARLLRQDLQPNEEHLLEEALRVLAQVPRFVPKNLPCRRGVFVGRRHSDRKDREGPRTFIPLLQTNAAKLIPRLAEILARENLDGQVALAAYLSECVSRTTKNDRTVIHHE